MRSTPDLSRDAVEAILNDLLHLAEALGAGAAVPVDTRSIPVEDHLATLCRPPGCPNYGRAASCPPHVGGPQWFRRLLTCFDRAIFFKIDLPGSSLMGPERPVHFRRLHQIAARMELAAVERGCPRARAFAGGSCKELFCADHPVCDVIHHAGPCRHAEAARPSMSGFGVDVFRLMATVGWSTHRISAADGAEADSMGSITGLVLVY